MKDSLVGSYWAAGGGSMQGKRIYKFGVR
jgi:hypothetical protein